MVGWVFFEIWCRKRHSLFRGINELIYIYMGVCVCVCVCRSVGGGWPISSVGIATDYGLEGPGSNLGGDETFRPSRPALGPTQPPVQWVPGLSRGQSAAGACC